MCIRDRTIGGRLTPRGCTISGRVENSQSFLPNLEVQTFLKLSQGTIGGRLTSRGCTIGGRVENSQRFLTNLEVQTFLKLSQGTLGGRLTTRGCTIGAVPYTHRTLPTQAQA